jgi:nucleotide-binding universal stress UspA family protein
MTDGAAPALIAYDGSDGAGTAIARASELLGPRRAVVVYVWQSLAGALLRTDVDGLSGTMREASDELDEEDRKAAEEIAERGADLAREAGFDAEARAVRGPFKAWATLLEEADVIDAAVVVLGSLGRGAVESVLFGSVSAGLLHRAARPVLVVPAEAEPATDGPVLIGYDGSEFARDAIEAAVPLLAGRAAVIATVWIPYAPVAGAGVVGAPAAVTARAVEQLETTAAARAADTAEEGARIAAAAGIEARSEPIRGTASTWSVLRDAAAAHGCAAIAVGSRGRGAVAGAVLGSTSAALVHNARLPILVVPPKSP